MSLHHIIKDVMTAAFYARHSTAKQNIETQRAFVEKFLSSYGCKKLEDKYVYVDENVSARKNKLEDRQSLMRLINDISTKKFDLIVVYQQDRLARDPSEHLFLRSLFKQANIPIVVASTNSLYDSGDLLTNIFRDGLSQYEVETLRIRTRDTLATLHEQGLWTGGKPPFGYKYVTKINPIEPNEFELLVVKDIFRLFKEKLGLQTIVKLLNQKHYSELPKPHLNKQLVKRILLNPIYAGYLIHRKGKDISSWSIVKTDLICEPLITLNEWENIYTMYITRKSESRTSIISKTNFWMRGLLYCANCKQELQHKNQINSMGKGNLWYWCRSSSCNYKLKANEVHTQCKDFINLLINEFTDDLLEHASNKRQQLIDQSLQQLIGLEHKIEKTKNILSTIDVKLNTLATSGSNIITSFNQNQQVTITDMLKGYRKKVEDEYIYLLSDKTHVTRITKMYESPDFVASSIKEMSDTGLVINSNEFNIYQRLIFQLVEKVIIYPIGVPSKKQVLEHVELEIKLNNY